MSGALSRFQPMHLRSAFVVLFALAPASVPSQAKGPEDRARQGAVTAGHLYVATVGSDANPGTPEAPFKTIEKASEAARPGTVVHVAPGIYPGGFKTTASGTAAERIRYVSERRWSAKIVPPPASDQDIAWDNRGSYVDIDGFDIDASDSPKKGKPWRIGIYNAGSYAAIKNNHVHHLARREECGTAGGAAISSDHYYRGVNSDVTDNVVHDIGFADCKYIHGIYISTSGTVVNNLVYNVGAAAIHLWHDAHDVLIRNNTVFASKFGIVVGAGDFYHRKEPADNIRVLNNIVFDTQYAVSEQGSVGRNNAYRDNMLYQNRINWQMKTGKPD